MADITKLSVDLIQWALINQAAMFACQDDMTRTGYETILHGQQANDGSTQWVLKIVIDDTNTLVARLGMMVVSFAGTIQVLSRKDFKDRFGIAFKPNAPGLAVLP